MPGLHTLTNTSKHIRANLYSCWFVKGNVLHNSSQHWTTAWEFPRYVWPGDDSSPSLSLPTMHHGTSVFSGPNVSTVLRGDLIFHFTNLHKICVIWLTFGRHTVYIALYHSVVWLDVMGQESQTVLDVVLLSHNWCWLSHPSAPNTLLCDVKWWVCLFVMVWSL